MGVELQEQKKKNEAGAIQRIAPQKGRPLKAKLPLPEYGNPFDNKTKRTLGTKNTICAISPQHF